MDQLNAVLEGKIVRNKFCVIDTGLCWAKHSGPLAAPHPGRRSCAWARQALTQVVGFLVGYTMQNLAVTMCIFSVGCILSLLVR